MRNIAVLVAFMNAAVANIVSAQSQILTAHSGATDPSTEGFSISSFMGVGTGSHSANDLGLPAWVITCPDNVSTQFGYVSGGVSANQQAEIATQGFTLSVIARALQGYAPAFNASTPYISPSQPVLNIQRAVYLTSSNLVVGSNYQIQASSDLINWTNQGSVFTATNSNWQSTNYWNVNDWNQLFFRLEVDP